MVKRANHMKYMNSSRLKFKQGKKGKAAWVAPGIEAFTQGELDGLCGIYAVINAYRLLFGDDFGHERAQKLFKRMAKAAPLAVFEGLGYNELLDLISLANRAVPAKLRLEVRPNLFRKPPQGPAWRVDTYLKKLREEVNEGGQVAILGLEKAHDHWTLLHKITPSTVKLTDSESISHLKLANCGVTAKTRRDYRIVPTQTIVLRPWVFSPNDMRKRKRVKRAS